MTPWENRSRCNAQSKDGGGEGGGVHFIKVAAFESGFEGRVKTTFNACSEL